MSWTDDRVERLKKMWNEGASASQIAKDLGGVTRNAVIGKVHRLGLSNRVGAAEAEEARAPEPAVKGGKATARAGSGKGAAKAAPAAPSRPSAAPAPRSTAARPAAKAAPSPAPAAKAPSAAPPPSPASHGGNVTPLPLRKPLVPGQPLPPQPSLNEISPETLASAREVEKRSKKLSLMELTERTCKWPVGDPATEDFWFCGLPAQAGKPYCDAHVSVAFQPMSARRDRRR